MELFKHILSSAIYLLGLTIFAVAAANKNMRYEHRVELYLLAIFLIALVQYD